MINFCGLSVLVLVFGLIKGEDFVYPTSLKRCPLDKPECFIPTIEEYLQKAGNGLTGINLVPIDPFEIKEMNIVQGKDSPVNVKLVMKNCLLTGLSAIKLTKVTGFKENPLITRVDVIGKVPLAELKGKYTIDGKVLIMPIQGDGDIKISLHETSLRAQFQFKESTTRDGKLYVKLKNFKFSIDPKKVVMHFGNLFRGDKLLGDTTNLFLNENWKDIFDEIKPALVSSLKVLLEKAINQVYEKVPYAETFSNQ